MQSETEYLWIPTHRGPELAATLYHRSDEALVIVTHGFMSERTSRGRTPHLADELCDEGYSVLALDFAGSGESDDEPLLIANQVEDLKQVIRYAREKGYRQIALWGHSLGARVAFEAADSEIKTILTVGGVTAPIPFDPANRFNADQLDELARTGFISEPRTGARDTVVVDGDLFREFDTKFSIKGVQCPVLCLHGDADETERGLSEVTRKRISALPEGSRLEVIEGADHTFMDRLPQLVDRGLDWLKTHMPI